MADMEVPFSFLNEKLAKKYGKCHNGVLEGNWFEDRILETDKIADKCKKNTRPLCIKHPTTTDSTYVVHTIHPELGSFRRVALLQRQINQRATSIAQCLYHGREFLNNMTTTTDLNYNHRINRDLLRSYGNLTHFGLREWYACMRHKDDDKSFYLSLMKDEYKCPGNEALQTHHRATPRSISTKLNRDNLTNYNLQLRGNKVLRISEPGNICVH